MKGKGFNQSKSRQPAKNRGEKMETFAVSGSDTFPCCLGYYGTPLPPNGPCQNCQYASVCAHVTENFVPKARLDPIMARIERIQAILRGEK
jgi:hypothetical protein